MNYYRCSQIDTVLLLDQDVEISNTTESIDTASGSLIVNGGIGINCSYNSTSITSGGSLTVGGDAVVNSDLYGRSVNGAYSNVYRMGGYYFTWDSDTYGVNTQHSIRSTYGDTYQDSITLNSYNHIRFNLVSNNNNSESFFQVGDGTTGTGNVIMTLNQAAKRPLVTGFVIDKAKENLDFNPVDFFEGIAIMDQQIKKNEI